MDGEAVTLKALVDKKNNRVIFVESDKDFVDVLLSFLSMPIGTINRLIHDLPPTTAVGCINNIHASVENLDVRWLRTEECKTMLLHPRNAVEAQCERLKLKIDSGQPPSYFCCNNRLSCDDITGIKFFNRYQNAPCWCGSIMSREMILYGKPVMHERVLDVLFEEPFLLDTRDGEFVKGAARCLVTDDLQLIPASASASFSLLTKSGVSDASAIEEKTFSIGVKEVLELLKLSLVSETPLTEILLQCKTIPNFRIEDSKHGSITHLVEEDDSEGNGHKINVKLGISKSKKMVCYAEATARFVDLLFSFLTTPLGHAAKEMRSGLSKGCVNNIYNSVQDLDAAKYLKTNDHKNILLDPKLAPGFGYKNHPLGLEEADNPKLYFIEDNCSALEEITTSYDPSYVNVIVVDPKSAAGKEATDGGGFVIEQAMFTVTDNLVITPISPVSGLWILNSLDVPFNDIEERIVQVGNKEARRLLVTSLSSESVLTDAFLREEPKDTFVLKVPKQEN